jgi:CheY-like chemotaxis protein
LFKEYIQIEYEQNTGIEGTGLGLAITRDIVRGMGGDIAVSSEYGKGSTFTVTLPQEKRSGDALASVKNPEEIAVLVYERREVYASSLNKTLDDLGVEHTLVFADSEFSGSVEKKKYTHIFIPFVLFERNIDAILKFGRGAKMVVLTEFGAAITDRSFSVLAMPAYSMPIADILNGVAENFLYNEDGGSIIRFTAPKAKILIVDDIQTNLKVAQGLLLPYKMNVELCNSGKEALNAVKGKNYDLIFMDHKMPDMDGVETTRRIRSMGVEDKYYKEVPIIALTANAISGIREEFLQNGFTDFISKPIDTIKLDFLLEKWLPKSKRKKVSTEDIASLSSVDDDTGEISIEGIDVTQGVFLSGGRLEFYLETLMIFYRDGLEKIREITTCLEAGDLDLYTIHVHALKSASANIGAAELSEIAAVLETAGERGDLNYIESNTSEFLAALGLLLKRINTVLEERKQNVDKNQNPGNMEQLKPILEDLKAAIEILDAGTINKSIQRLQEVQQARDIGEAITNISDKILFGEYDEAAALIDELLK